MDSANLIGASAAVNLAQEHQKSTDGAVAVASSPSPAAAAGHAGILGMPPPPPPPNVKSSVGVAASAASAAGAVSGASPAPKRTLYVNNLNCKIKLDQLRAELRAIFENFGKVVAVVALGSFWRRGQAWIVFEHQDVAAKALEGLQGFPYHDKPLRIQYAQEESHVHTKAEGTYVERPPGPRKPRAILLREKELQAQLELFQKLVAQHSAQIQAAQLAHQMNHARILAGAAIWTQQQRPEAMEVGPPAQPAALHYGAAVPPPMIRMPTAGPNVGGAAPRDKSSIVAAAAAAAAAQAAARRAAAAAAAAAAERL